MIRKLRSTVSLEELCRRQRVYWRRSRSMSSDTVSVSKKNMEKVFGKPESLNDTGFSYCPGCHHGIINRLIAEVIDELGIKEKTVGTAPVGCSVFLYEWFDVDVVQPAHGRVSAVA